jgi:xanthine dehydrogenase accessory factor
VRINLTDTDEVTGTAGCGGALKVAIWKPIAAFAQQARAILSGQQDCWVELDEGFHFELRAKRRLLLVGATTLAQALAKMAKPLDFYVTVVDPRPVFANAERIPDADRLVLEWPDAYLPRELAHASALVVLSHDPKFDIPALQCALRSDVPYIGLLGSRRSQAARRDSLRSLGYDERALARIHGPVGLDLGGRTTAETALSILAQIVATENARSGGALDRANGNIHASQTLEKLAASAQVPRASRRRSTRLRLP